MIRNGPDNVASLVDAARKYPEQWGEQAMRVENAVRRWNIALQESLQYRQRVATLPSSLRRACL